MNQAAFQVSPVRCSGDPSAFARFLEVLGLTPLPGRGPLLMFTGRGGSVGVGAADATPFGLEEGQTALAFTASDLPAGLEQLRTQGVSVDDAEQAGEPSCAVDRNGHRIALLTLWSPDPRDPRAQSHPASASMDVVALYPSADPDQDATFFAAFGLVGGAVDDPWPRGLRSMAHRGVVGLHTVTQHDDAGSARPDAPALVRLGFETSEPLDALTGRLHAAGYASATVVGAASAPYIRLVDPDGQPVDIHLTA